MEFTVKSNREHSLLFEKLQPITIMFKLFAQLAKYLPHEMKESLQLSCK